MSSKIFTTKGWLAIFILLTALGTHAIELTTMALKAEAMETVWITIEAPAPIATPTAPMHPSYTDTSILKKDMPQVTNDYRKKHDAKPLTWNDTLAQYSKKWADACIWKHSHGGYGENLAYGFQNLSDAIIAWGDEGKFYDYDLPTGFAEETGHFTQLVWKASRQVGCAAVNCGYTIPKSKNREKRDSKITPQVTVPGEFDKLTKRADDDEQEDARAQGWYVVCEYMPPGNAVGDDNKSFRKNVLPANRKVPDPTPTSSPNNATSTATGDKTSKTSGALRNGFDAATRVLLVSLVMICVGVGL